MKDERKRLTTDDFEALALIGKGAFGEVRLVKMKERNSKVNLVISVYICVSIISLLMHIGSLCHEIHVEGCHDHEESG